jgi:hypothetical protein
MDGWMDWCFEEMGDEDQDEDEDEDEDEDR